MRSEDFLFVDLGFFDIFWTIGVFPVIVVLENFELRFVSYIESLVFNSYSNDGWDEQVKCYYLLAV